MNKEDYKILPLHQARTTGWKDIIFNDPCVWCGGKLDKPSREHIKPVKHGGTDKWENIVGACAKCNIVRGIGSILMTLINPPPKLAERMKENGSFRSDLQ